MLLDFIATNNWTLPIYFSVTSGQEEYQNLGAYLQQEGLAYRLVPIKSPMQGGQDDQRIATDIMYNNMMTKFRWGKLDVNESYVDFVMANQSQNLRSVFQKLARQLMIEGKKDSARKVLEKCFAVIPEKNVPYNSFMVPIIDLYFRAGAQDKAAPMTMHMADLMIEEMDYYSKVKNNDLPAVQGEIQRNLYFMGNLIQLGEEFKLPALVSKVKPRMEAYQQRFAMFNQQGQ